MELVESLLKGCYLIQPFHHTDSRGDFVKIYNADFCANLGLEFDIKEVYYSTSAKNVFRGFHFQVPPADHAKIVFCISGEVTDYVLDLRTSSKNYGKCVSFELNEKNKHGVYIPKGCAHGFYSKCDNSVLTYLLETEHSKEFDRGLHWSAIKNNRIIKPELSERDLGFESIEQFVSPFK